MNSPETTELWAVSSIVLLALLFAGAVCLVGVLHSLIGVLGSLSRLEETLNDGIQSKSCEHEKNHGEPYQPYSQNVDSFREVCDPSLQREVGFGGCVGRFRRFYHQGGQSLLRVRNSLGRVAVKSKKFVVYVVEKMPSDFCDVVFRFFFCLLSMSAKMLGYGVLHISSANVEVTGDPLEAACRFGVFVI